MNDPVDGVLPPRSEPQVEICRRVGVCAGLFAGLILTNNISNSKSGNKAPSLKRRSRPTILSFIKEGLWVV